MMRRSAALLAGVLVLGLVARTAIANPQGPTVVHGDASFANPAAGHLQINNTPNAIINWQSFSIGATETTRFVQPSPASAVLNRVVGGDLSAIYGQLLSNGRVFLINPAGIVIGPNALVDTAGLIASTLQMTDADFIAGRMRFAEVGQAGGIENHGLIHSAPGGEVVLIAPDIENSGIISVDGGQLILAAGRKLTLTSLDTKNIAFEVQAPDDRVVNLGELLADGGAVGAFAGTLRNRGLVRANSIELDANGDVVLRASADLTLESGSAVEANGASGGQILIDGGAGAVTLAGQLSATGASELGGEIRVTGDHVTVTDGASVDVSGASGGGKVLLGGARRDQADSAMAEARLTDVTAGARVVADASVVGNGGEIVIWGSEAARVAGELSARGGSDGGDGGFVETSAGGRLVVLRGPTLTAAAGRGGTWFIDPDDIRIVAGDGQTDNLGMPLFTSTAGESQIGATLINEQLDIGSNILITTSGFGDGSSSGDIIVDAPLLKTTTEGGTTSLDLRAHGDVLVNAPIGSTGERLSVALRGDFLAPDAQGAVTVNAPIATAGGTFTASAGESVTLSAAIDTRRSSGGAGSASVTAGGNVALGATAPGSINTGTSSVSVNAASGQRFSLSSGSSLNAGFVTVTADDVSIDGTVAASGSMTIRPTTFSRPVSIGTEMAGSLALNSAELARLSAGTTLTLGSTSAGLVTIGAPVALTAAQNLTLQGASLNQVAGAAISVPGFFTSSISGAATYAAAINAGTGMSLVGTDTIMSGAASTASGTLSMSTDTLDLTGTLGAGGGSGLVRVQTRSFRPVDLGSEAAGSLSITDAELDRIAASRVEIGGFAASQLTVTAPISPGGTSDLALRASGLVTQNAGAAVSSSSLGLFSTSDDVIFTEANVVSTLAGSAGFGQLFEFDGAAPLLTIGTAGGGSGIFGSAGTVIVESDALDLLATVSTGFFTGTVILRPRTPGNAVSLGGADAAGVLGLLDSEINRVFTGQLVVQADSVSVPAPVSWFGGNELVLSPQTAARPISLGTSVGGSLSLTTADIANWSGSGLRLGDSDTAAVGSGPISTGANVTLGSNLALVTADPAGVQIDHAVSANTDLTVHADAIGFGAGGSLTASGTVTLAPNLIGKNIDAGGFASDPTALLFSANDLNTRVIAATLTLGSASAGDVIVSDILGGAMFSSFAVRGTNYSQSASVTVAQDIDISVANALSVNAPLASTSGNMFLSSDTSANFTAAVSASGDIEVSPRSSFTDVSLGGAGAGLAITGVDNLAAGGILYVGDSDFETDVITIVAPIAPGGSQVLVLRGNDVTQAAGSTITASELGVQTVFDVTLNEANPVDEIAGFSFNGMFEFSNDGINPLIIGVVDSEFGIEAFDGDVKLVANMFDLQQDVVAFGNNVTLKTLSAGSSLDIGLVGGVLPVVAGSLTVLADGIRISNPVSVGVDELTLAPRSSLNVDIVAALGAPGPLEILVGDLENLTLNTDAKVTVGDATSTSDLTVVAPTAITAFDNLQLVAGADVVVDAALTLAGSVGVVSDSIQFNAPVSAAKVTAEALTAGNLVVDPLLVNQVTATDFVLGGAMTGAVTLGGPIAPPTVANLTLQGQSLTLAAGDTIAVTGDLTLLADDVDLGDNVTSTAGGRITIAPRTFNRPVDVGTETAGRLSLTAAELARAVTSGTLQIGEPNGTGLLDVSAPVSAPAAGALALVSRSTVSQAGGAVITAPNLRVASTFGSVTLNEANLVGALSGTAGGAFSFTAGQPLSVSTVDGVAGTSGSVVSLTADVMELLANVGRAGATINLAPASAGRSISLGAEAGGSLGLTNAELGRVVGNTLNIGNANSGTITVASATELTSVNNLNLTSAGNTINVNAPLTVPGSIELKSDAINILAALVSRFGNITMRPLSAGLPIVLGSKTSGALSLSAAELALIGIRDFGSLTIGATDSGAVAIEVPIAFVHNLILRSGAGITQSAGATITTSGLVISASGEVNLPADNDVGFFSASVSGAGNGLVFNNLKPLRLQDVFGSAGTGGRVIITSGRSGVVGAFDGDGELPDIIDLILALQEDSEKLKKKSRKSKDGDESENAEETLQCS